MLIDPTTAAGIRDGRVTLAFRRWDAPRVKVGHTQRIAGGLARFLLVDPVDRSALTEADAVAAGLPSLAALDKRMLRSTGQQLYRIELEWAGADERVTLRETVPDAAELAEIATQLDRLDAGRRSGPWTRAMLGLIAASPATSAVLLAEAVGREKKPFKLDVRRLKALGLTNSLPVGYELSPRGRALLAYEADPSG